MKTSLKKFQGRSVLQGDGREGVEVDNALLNKVKDVLVAQGWKKPPVRRRSNSNPDESPSSKPQNSPFYKSRKNPLGQDGKPLRCFKCQSEYHMADKCPNKDNKSEFGKDNKEVPKKDSALISANLSEKEKTLEMRRKLPCFAQIRNEKQATKTTRNWSW